MKPPIPRSRWAAAGALTLAFTAGGLVLPPLAATAQSQASHAMMGGPQGMHGQMMAHVARLLDAVDATPDQKARIHTILRDALAPMMDMRPAMDAAHRRLAQILAAPTVDRAALEQMRSEHMAMLDSASRRLVTALADAADVLTPEQRAKLATLVAEHHQGP
jgi:Spy/CpxP family protein refolding chaperone